MLMRTLFFMVGFMSLIGLVTMLLVVGPAVIDARRNLSGVCCRSYPVLLGLHRFFIAISRTVVNHDGFDGTALDPLVWSAGSLPKGGGSFMLFVTLLWLLVLRLSGLVSGLLVLVLLLVLMISLSGLTLLVFWLNGFLFLVLCSGLLGGRNLVLVVFLMLSCSFFMNFGLERG